MINKKYLLVIASVVWMIAGFNVLRLGIMEYKKFIGFALAALTIIIFIIFGILFFSMVVKNTKRITEYEEEKQLFLKFFTAKSYIMIALMMTLGIVLRNISAVPRFFIAFFYVGLGMALFLAGVIFFINFLKFNKENATV